MRGQLSGCSAPPPSDLISRGPRNERKVTRPQSDDDLAFLTVAELGVLLRERWVSSEELTRLYLDRLERFDPVLRCVITLTPDLALEQAALAQTGHSRTLENRAFDRRVLGDLRGLGHHLVPVELPDSVPIAPLGLILTAEASAAFDELTRSGQDDLLVRQIENAWPNVFRQGQLIPAVEYLRANRIRSLLMRAMDETMVDVDVFVVPSFGGDQLLLTNLTGHPAIALPHGYRSADGTPTSVTCVGRLFGETDLLSVASRWQEETGYHRNRPPI